MHPTTKAYNICFEQGVEARASRQAEVDNPYPIGTDEHDAWTAGWRATCDLDEDDDPESNRIDVSAETD